jgi:hypothetical protein
MTHFKGEPSAGCGSGNRTAATSGLSQTDKENLMKGLNALEQLNSRSFLLGGADRAKVEEVMRAVG